ncbi:MAG: hypothetical protein K6C97_12005, partial [Treponema sp.]|nr:hypothetical protein [Treponema sp.]
MSTQVSREFHVDMAAPVVRVSAPESEYVNYSTNADHSRKIRFEGSVVETNGLESFTINSTDILSSVQDDGSWSYEVTPDTDGTYTYIVTATDKVGKTNSLTKTVTVDTARPTVSNVQTKFTVPTSTETEGSLFKFEGQAGSVADAATGSGLDRVEIAFTSDSNAPASAQANVTPSSNGSWSSTVEFASVLNGEGTKYLWVKAYDKAGNASDWTNVKSFVYDTAAPTISFTATAGNTNPATNSYRKAGFKLEVSASDSNGIQDVKVTYAATTKDTSSDTSGIYYKEFVVGSANTSAENYLADGTYDFIVTATDSSGKTKSVSRTITVDTTIPSGTFDTSNFAPSGTSVGSGDEAKTWYKSSSIKFAVNVTEANISSVEISKSENTGFEPMSLSNTSYVGTISDLSEGLNTIYVKMTDLAGNSGTTSTVVYVDSTAPASLTAYDAAGNVINGSLLTNQSQDKDVYIAVEDECVRGKKISSTTKPESWPSGCYIDEDLTTAVAAGTNYSQNIYYEKDLDTITGIDTVSFGNAPGTLQTSGTNNGRYEITIPKASQSGNINITVTDKAGNSARLLAFRFESDTVKPVVAISTPSATSLYGTKDITGTVTETNPKSVSLYYRTSTPTADTAPTVNDSGWTLIKTITKDSGTDTTTVKYNATDSEIYSWTV